MFQNGIPLNWPQNGLPEPQGPYYCGAGANRVYGRDLAIAHREACLQAELLYYGMNAEVMPSQWEFQIGYRGVENDNPGILNSCDHLWLARYILQRLGENYNIDISFENKPIKGDWNGAGLHTNFSTKDMRDKNTGRDAIKNAIENLEKKHREHIAVYGFNLHERLTGAHETSSIEEFSAGDAHRGCSIRIPRPVAQKGYGYIEDRRPGANSDPYIIAAKLVETVLCKNKIHA